MLISHTLLGSVLGFLVTVVALPSFRTISSKINSNVARSLLPPTNDGSFVSATGLPISNTTLTSGAYCFVPTPGTPPLMPIATIYDCFGAVTAVMSDPFCLVPRQWGKIGSIWAPFRWQYQSCAIAAIQVRPNVEDSFPPALIAQAAAAIINKCLTGNRPLLGGRFLVGSAQVIDVVVAHSW